MLVGISHRTAPVELRERLDFQARGIDRALRALAERGAAREAVVLSTCNRAELYAACDDLALSRASLLAFVSEFNGVAEVFSSTVSVAQFVTLVQVPLTRTQYAPASPA